MLVNDNETVGIEAGCGSGGDIVVVVAVVVAVVGGDCSGNVGNDKKR